MRKRRPEGLKFSHPPQPFSLPIFAVWGAFSRLASSSSATFAQRRRDAKAGTGLARPDLNKLQLGCQQRLTNAELARWASSPFNSVINSGMKIACVFSNHSCVGGGLDTPGLASSAGRQLSPSSPSTSCSKKANKINLPLFSLPSPRAFAGRCAGGAGGEPRFALVIGGGGIALGDSLRHAGGI